MIYTPEQQKTVDAWYALKARLYELEVFKKSDAFKALPERQRDLWSKKLDYMRNEEAVTGKIVEEYRREYNDRVSSVSCVEKEDCMIDYSLQSRAITLQKERSKNG